MAPHNPLRDFSISRLALLVTALTACGSPEAPVEDAGPELAICPAAPAADTPYSTPDSLPDEGCVEGSMGEVDLEGSWVVTMSEVPEISFMMTFSGCDGGQMLNNQGLVQREPDHVFAFEGPTSPTKLCWQGADGSLGGYTRHCDYQGCRVVEVKAERFDPTIDAGGDTGLALLSHSPGRSTGPAALRAVAVDGNTAYLVFSDELVVIDVTDPTSPTQIGSFTLESLILGDVEIVHTSAYTFALLVIGGGLLVVDVTDPSAPSEYEWRGGRNVSNVCVAPVEGGARAYTTGGVVEVFDVVGDHAGPIAAFEPSTYVISDCFVDGSVGYFNASGEGLVVADVSDVTAPEILGRFLEGETPFSYDNWGTSVDGRKLVLHSGQFAGSGLHVLDADVGIPDFGATLDFYQRDPRISVGHVVASRSRVYLTHFQLGLGVFDLDAEGKLSPIGYEQTWDASASLGYFFEGAYDVALDEERGLVFVVDDTSGLWIFRDEALLE